MKKGFIIVVLMVSLAAEILVCLLIMNRMGDIKQDPVMINRCKQLIEESIEKVGHAEVRSDDEAWSSELEQRLREADFDDSLSFSVLDLRSNPVYKNAEDATTSINKAIQNSDTILDLTIHKTNVGKVIISNQIFDQLTINRQEIQLCMIMISLFQILILSLYLVYLYRRILRPFGKLQDFAARVAGGNLDLPLDMDRGHIFGVFTESFDLMRSELKTARISEKRANDEKKEVIAKLSHDIKTPVASIKSTSEMGYELTMEERTKELFNTINIKSDQIKTLTDNLFTSSVHDVTEIAVNPSSQSSETVASAIKNADYMNRAAHFEIPDCRVFVDKLRLQQAFDNVFMNSYKYADTEITISASLEDDYLTVRIADTGPGVSPEELPLLTEKYRRGSDVEGRDGAGLGLYLTEYFIRKMDGYIELASEDGFVVTFYIRIT